MPNLITADIATTVSIVATSGQTVFNFPFPIFEVGDIDVDIDGVVTAAFTVTGAGAAAGGTVVLTTGATVGQTINIVRDVPIKRYIDLPATGPVNMENVDSEFDRFFAIAQQLKSGLLRTLQVAIGAVGLVFPSAAARASKILAFDGAGAISMITTASLIGAAGPAATVTVGSVTTLAPGGTATVTNVGTSSAAIFNFAIPQGDGAGFTTEEIQDMVATMLIAGSNMTVSYNDALGSVTLSSVHVPAPGSIIFSMIENAGGMTLVGNNAAGAGSVKALTATQATTIPNAVTTLLKGLVPPPGAGMAHKFFRGDATWDGVEETFILACSDETTAITAAVNKLVFRVPYACTIVSVKASLTTAQASGTIFTVDVNKSGATILSTKITIDNTERTSLTAVTAPVMSSTTLTADEEVSVDVDLIGDSTAKGLKVTMILRRTA